MTLNPHAPSSGSDYGIFLIYFLWVVCIVFFFLGICKIMKRYCLPFHEDPTFLFRRRSQRRLLGENMDEPSSQLQSGGLASRVIHSLPTLQFRNETESGANSSLQSSSDCAVCLGEFFEGEWLRLLPNCSHVFHVSCIDTWFRSHSSCPLCRANVVDDPSSLPIALETLQREGMHSERHPYGLLEILLDEDRARSGEIWLRATTPSRLGSDSGESFSCILPPMGGLVNQYSAEALIRLAHNFNGEPSSWELDPDGHTVETSNGGSEM